VASNIFVGVESAGMVRPFLADFTRSEFFCILTAAMATVASSTMGVYVMTLSDIMPNIAGHLMSASIISAPAAICVAKIMEPETGEPLTMGKTVDPETGKYSSFMEAIVQGSQDGVKLVIGVMALLLSFLGLVSLLNHILSWFGELAGFTSLNLEMILGYLGWPLALIMGVPAPDASDVGQLLGQRILLTEIPAYTHLAHLAQNGGLDFGRSVLVASYALCGFTHVGSVAIFVGGFGALAPDRMGELSSLGFKALLAATLATCMTGCIAGMFAFGAETLLNLGK
jgi:CNT family concentrative nucleoside transporter